MKRLGLLGIAAAAALLCATPFSPQWSKKEGFSVSLNRAHAVVGRPATPMSAAGVARRQARRNYHYHGHIYHHRVYRNGRYHYY
jgi:hypothetical protein